jgi:coenzyme F420-reducing hydrogenase beta subunit
VIKPKPVLYRTEILEFKMPIQNQMIGIRGETRTNTDCEKHPGQVEALSQYLDAGDSSVLDLNAGKTHLEAFLSSGIEYYPVDFMKQDNRTIICDFNKHEFPIIKADVLFLNEILERVEDTEWFFDQVASFANNKVLLSYHTADISSSVNYRREQGWKNDLSLNDLLHAFHSRGFILHKASLLDSAQPLFYWIKAFPKNLPLNYFCTGCGACANVCPAEAIAFKHDENGFIRIEHRNETCTDCDSCVSLCPTIHPQFVNNPSPKTYAFLAQDGIRKSSSSGGLFPLLAKSFIEDGGKVCGAVWDDSLHVSHVLSDRQLDVDAMRKSKYLQSFIDTVLLRKIKESLDSGIRVLFTGCPCQVAGLNAFLQKRYEHLYTVDILCHYSPSPQHFDKYLNDCFRKDTIDAYEFRVKDNRWSCDIRLSFKDGTTYIKHESDDCYQRGFHARLFMSDSCARCRFCYFPRQGDISIGDYHGIPEHDAHLDDTRGTSLVFINNNKGAELFAMVEPSAKISVETPSQWAMDNRVHDDFQPHSARKRFFDLVKYTPFDKAVDYCLNNRYDIAVVGDWSVENYGAELSYFALYSVLLDKGFEPLLIERPLDSPWRPNATPILFRKNPYRSFDMAPLYRNKTTMSELNYRSNIFLVGSDQLFNDYLYHHFGEFVALDWVNDRNQKIAYAASWGSDYFWGSDETRSKMAYFLKKFDALSVREESAIALAKELFCVESTLVLDPVFLCNQSHYEELIARGTAIESDYLAVYLLDPMPWKEQVIKGISEAAGMESYLFSDIADHRKEPLFREIVTSQNKCCEDWLRCLAESKFVIADSFHGICFAVIFRKPFLALADASRGLTRFISLLNLLQLQDRLISHDSLPTSENYTRYLKLDYSTIEELFDREKKKSNDWLEDALSSGSQSKPASTYDFLRAYRRVIDDFANNINRRLAVVDDFADGVNQRLAVVDDFADGVGKRFREIAQQLAAIENTLSKITDDNAAKQNNNAPPN